MERRNIFETAENFNNGIVNLFMEADGYDIYADRIDGSLEFSHTNKAHDEVLVLFQGELSIMLDGEKVDLKSGDVLRIPAGVTHENVVAENSIFLLFEMK